MDIPRERVRNLRPFYLAGGATLVVAVLAFGVSRIRPAAPAVEKGGVWVDTVKRGSMLRAVKGRALWFPSTSGGSPPTPRAGWSGSTFAPAPR